MKKHFFAWMTIMMVAFVGITAVACSKEDNSQNANAEIIGKWRREYKETIKYIKNGGAWKEDSRSSKSYPEGSSDGYIFKSDGTALMVDISPDGHYFIEESDDFFYKVENGHLFLKENNPRDKDGWEDVAAIKISGSTMELTEEEIEGDYKEVTFLRYKKLN